MKLDIRVPLGLLFLILGVLLAVFGMNGNQALYDLSLHINVNFWWGTVLLVFGGAMFVLGRRSHFRAASIADSSAAGPVHKNASQSK